MRFFRLTRFKKVKSFEEKIIEIEEEMFSKLSQQEVNWYQEMLEKAQKSPEEGIEEIKRPKKGE